MHVSEDFARGVRIVLGCALALVAALFLMTSINPPGHVNAQNAGVVGIMAKLQPVFTSQSTTKSSGVFQDIGQGVNILRYCDTSFVGTIDLEWLPPALSVYQPLVTATYNVGDTGCHSLTVNGYWPNLRSTITPASGSASAWYSASSGPVGYAAPAISSLGPTSPISCDVSDFTSQTTGGVGGLAGNWVTNNASVLCGFSLSFNGATSAGVVQIGFSSSILCTSPIYVWEIFTTANTPQTQAFPLQIRNLGTPGPYPCVNNTSGATVVVAYNHASVQL